MIIIKCMEKRQKTVFITGASSGIGKETAKLLAEKGFKVFAGIRRKSDKFELEKINKNINGVYIDVTNSSSINKAFWYIIKNTEKIDVLINNAGIAVAAPLEILPLKALKEQFEVNTFAPVLVTQKFLPLLSGGKIINTSSMAASGIFPYLSAYCASKRALDILFNSFYLENKDNIRVISVKPAVIRTPIWEKSSRLARKNLEETSPQALAKYETCLLKLEKKALNNSISAIGTDKVAKLILKIINCPNPKSSYNIGLAAHLASLISKLPQDFLNSLIRLGMKKI